MILKPWNISVVLVRPKFSVNVGYSSRAMTNMGVDRMILVDPNCEIDMRAREGAAGGNGPLFSSILYNNWNEFYAKEGTGLRLGLTNRAGEYRTTRPLHTVLSEIVNDETRSEIPPHIYLIFGPEDHGLTTEDLKMVHHSCALPTFGENNSMNLAHAVLLTLFLTRSVLMGQNFMFEAAISPAGDLRPSSESIPPGPLDFPSTLVEEWLLELGFELSSRPKHAGVQLSNMLLRAVPNPRELKLLSDILHQTLRKLRARSLEGSQA